MKVLEFALQSGITVSSSFLFKFGWGFSNQTCVTFQMMKEAKFMSNLDHKHIVRMIGKQLKY